MIFVSGLCFVVLFAFTFGPERANCSSNVDAYKILNAAINAKVYYVSITADDIATCVSLDQISLNPDTKTAKYDGIQIPPGSKLPVKFNLTMTATNHTSVGKTTFNGDEDLSYFREYAYSDYETCLIDHSSSPVPFPGPASKYTGCRMYALNGATPEEIAECKTHFVNCGKPIQVYNSACNDIKLP